MKPVGVYLIQVCRLLAEAFAYSLKGRPEVHLLGSTPNLEQALATLPSLPVDLLMIDVCSYVCEAQEMILEIWESFPDLKILPIGVPSEEDVISFLEAGASGYVMRQSSLSELLSTIVAIQRGEPPCSPRIATSVCARIVELSRDKKQRQGQQNISLTPREREVLQLVAESQSNKEIARNLAITLPTVKNHIHHILEKLQVRGRRQAIRRAYERGLLRKERACVPLAGPFQFS